jgi:hypothetical protein
MGHRILRVGEPYDKNISVVIGVRPEPEASSGNGSFVVYAKSVTEGAGRTGMRAPHGDWQRRKPVKCHFIPHKSHVDCPEFQPELCGAKTKLWRILGN